MSPTSFVAVLPSIYPEYTHACVDSCRFEASRLLFVDNTKHNLGVAASWNLGIDWMRARRADWLVIVSAAVRFGPSGGLDLIEALDEHPRAIAVEADNDLGWHLIAFNRRTFDAAGKFDENLWPAYREDVDMSWRIQKALGLGPANYPLWPKVPTDATLVEVAHGIKRGGVTVDFEALRRYYLRKWSGESGSELWSHPFDDETKSVSWWPRPPDSRALLLPGHVGWEPKVRV